MWPWHRLLFHLAEMEVHMPWMINFLLHVLLATWLSWWMMLGFPRFAARFSYNAHVPSVVWAFACSHHWGSASVCTACW